MEELMQRTGSTYCSAQSVSLAEPQNNPESIGDQGRLASSFFIEK
jgi:hypothetical protein